MSRWQPRGARRRFVAARPSAAPAPAYESDIQYDIRVALGLLPDLVMYRNSTGVVKHVDPDGTERTIRYGLVKGGSDLVGMLSMQVRLVPREPAQPVPREPITLARWFALEVKRPGERPTDDQERFLRLVRRMGGFGAVVTSVPEALAAYERARGGACE